MSNTNRLQSILLIGVTGPTSFGQFVVKSLIPQLTHFKRVAVYHDTSRPTDERKANTLSQLKNFGIEIVSSNGYESTDPFVGFDCVLSFLGNHALHLQPKIFDLAIEAGVRHFYPSEFGADVMVGENRTQRYYKYKVITREHLERRGHEISELGWTIFMLGRLTEWATLSHFGIDNRNFKAKIYGTATGRQSLIAAADAAAYIVASLRTQFQKTSSDGSDTTSSSHRRWLRISGSSPTYAEIFETLKTIRGRAYDVTYLNVEDASIEEREAKARDDVDAELEASHKLIQGRQGTLLPKPWNNSDFPDVGPLLTVEEALRAAYQSNLFRMAYGLPPAEV